jgi:hypothetical protein
MSEAVDLLRKLLAVNERILAALEAGKPKPVADDADLDSSYGNPAIAKDPKSWTGESQIGKRMSECDPAYLDAYASREDFFAQKADDAGETDAKGRPRSFYNRRDAARARGWSARLRSGWTPPAEPAFGDDAPMDAANPFNDDNIAF